MRQLLKLSKLEKSAPMEEDGQECGSSWAMALEQGCAQMLFFQHFVRLAHAHAECAIALPYLVGSVLKAGRGKAEIEMQGQG